MKKVGISVNRKPLLIFGNGTAGKTTLARSLVREGVYDAYLETDDFQQYSSGWDSPFQEGLKDGWGKGWADHISRTMRLLSYSLLGATRKYSVVVCGLWPGMEKSLLPMLNDYECIVLLQRDRALALKAWLERGGSQTDFDSLWPRATWDNLISSFDQLAEALKQRGKLVDPLSRAVQIGGHPDADVIYDDRSPESDGVSNSTSDSGVVNNSQSGGPSAKIGPEGEGKKGGRDENMAIKKARRIDNTREEPTDSEEDD